MAVGAGKASCPSGVLLHPLSEPWPHPHPSPPRRLPCPAGHRTGNHGVESRAPDEMTAGSSQKGNLLLEVTGRLEARGGGIRSPVLLPAPADDPDSGNKRVLQPSSRTKSGAGAPPSGLLCPWDQAYSRRLCSRASFPFQSPQEE